MNDFTTHLTERERDAVACYAWFEMLCLTNPFAAVWLHVNMERFTFNPNCRSAK